MRRGAGKTPGDFRVSSEGWAVDSLCAGSCATSGVQTPLQRCHQRFWVPRSPSITPQAGSAAPVRERIACARHVSTSPSQGGFLELPYSKSHPWSLVLTVFLTTTCILLIDVLRSPPFLQGVHLKTLPQTEEIPNPIYTAFSYTATHLW
jgi:hypothetical protein